MKDKNLSEMTLNEYNEHISEMVKLYRKEMKEITKPSGFIYNGIYYTKDTPDYLWDELINFKKGLT